MMTSRSFSGCGLTKSSKERTYDEKMHSQVFEGGIGSRGLQGIYLDKIS